MPIITYDTLDVVESAGILGTQKYVSDSNNNVMYGNGVKSFFSNLWSFVKPIVKDIVKMPETKSIVNKLLNKGVEAGFEKLGNVLEGGNIPGSKLSREQNKKLLNILNRGKLKSSITINNLTPQKKQRLRDILNGGLSGNHIKYGSGVKYLK